MKIKIGIVVIMILASGCKNNKRLAERDSDFEQLTNEKNEFYEKLQTRKFEYKDALSITDSYKRFFDKYPEDKDKPDLMMELADISYNYLNDHKDAIGYYSLVIEDYPDYENVPIAIFILATIYHDRLQDYKKAKQYYEKLIKEYPDHYFVKDAKIMLDNLGKSPEESLEEILKKKALREAEQNQEG